LGDRDLSGIHLERVAVRQLTPRDRRGPQLCGEAIVNFAFSGLERFEVASEYGLTGTGLSGQDEHAKK
jgi:hypothetical protein